MAEQTILSLQEFSKLFQNIILAEYDNLFSNADLRRDLGLDNETTVRFGLEYLCAAVFLMNDLLKVSTHPKTVTEQLDNTTRASVFRRILSGSATEGIEAQYVLYSLKRGIQLETIFQRNDESMKLLIEACLDQVGQNDPISRLPQSLYLMNLLPAIVCLMGDLIRSAEPILREEELLFRIIPPEECEKEETSTEKES
jgi:hypothetical protein